VITRPDRGDPGARLHYDARSFMAENRRKQPLGIGARKCELIDVADAGRLDLDQYFPVLWTFEVGLYDFERFAFFKGDCCACVAAGAVPERPYCTTGRLDSLVSLSSSGR
jgi:hypothetical protein